MTEKKAKQETKLANSETSQNGFWERALLSQLKKIDRGSLTVETNNGTQQLGSPSQDRITATIQVTNSDFFRKACLGGSLGVADSYAEGDWKTDDLVSVFRLFLQNQDVMDGMESGWASLLNRVARWGYLIGQKNTIKGSRKNIALHYDLGNDFYELMLDPTMTYSCGIFNSPESTLEEASLAKYDRIIDQLDIQPHHHILEIGCGWGGFADRLAQRTQAKLTATTISERQFEYAQKRIQKNGFEDRISIIKKDYRDLVGQFDRIVSIEMIEAVGHEFLPGYFSKISDLLLSNGAAMIQGITMPDHRYR
ncbi:MAG: class I SAM-dependent methyltransferase, partial [Opitutae bacterium]|nr:class I SAM-dependent methyltransferase [Opitutae bacterium]